MCVPHHLGLETLTFRNLLSGHSFMLIPITRNVLGLSSVPFGTTYITLNQKTKKQCLFVCE